MKERPILFSAPMVRALLAGTKTQTRRVVALPRSRDSFVLEDHGDGWWPYQSDDGESSLCNDGMEHIYSCPYGAPGDRLWVRETWMADPPITDDWPSTQFAGCKPRDHSLIPERFRDPRFCLYRADGHDLHGWTPAIHMPRWASRITLEVTEVRVERLQTISDEDVLAEGTPGAWVDWTEEGRGYLPNSNGPETRQFFYRKLWEEINGTGSWAANPWVWCVSFKRIIQP